MHTSVNILATYTYMKAYRYCECVYNVYVYICVNTNNTMPIYTLIQSHTHTQRHKKEGHRPHGIVIKHFVKSKSVMCSTYSSLCVEREPATLDINN